MGNEFLREWRVAWTLINADHWQTISPDQSGAINFNSAVGDRSRWGSQEGLLVTRDDQLVAEEGAYGVAFASLNDRTPIWVDIAAIEAETGPPPGQLRRWVIAHEAGHKMYFAHPTPVSYRYEAVNWIEPTGTREELQRFWPTRRQTAISF